MLTAVQQERYARHLILEGVGEEGQEKLLAGRVLVIGAGGLGSPVLFYLVAAGVGTVGIADGDLVELSNLQRQIIHTTAAVGTPKVASAAASLQALNPDVTLVTHNLRVTAENIMALIAGYDFVIDATDNFESKFLINDACVLAGKSYSHGGILRFRGQTTTICPGDTACYRCIFPEAPESEVALACSRAGVLGVLPGIIGTIQATEAIKYILGEGKLLAGRLLTYDSHGLTFREVTLRRNPGCPLCGEAPTISAL
ncbi:MAG TPA: molybdopterin-synthase adenylyltransferase MoeB [Geobacteraceae bacterium]|nr:molybdopterin-synthase adenylyltransferase MoeB [Geobacteraceae bacterium]